MEAAVAASYPEYVAAAKATQAWVAWQEGRPEDVVALAGEALELWGTTVVSYPWYWLCLWPLISVRLAASQGAEAVEAADSCWCLPNKGSQMSWKLPSRRPSTTGDKERRNEPWRNWARPSSWPGG